MRNIQKRTGDCGLAVALIRVSTEEQHLGPIAQRAAIEGWATREKVVVVSWRIEQGVSGAAPLERRSELLCALEDLKHHNAGRLVVAKRDRLGRDVVLVAMIERLVERSGARVYAADGSGDAQGPEGILLRGIIDLFAQFERHLISTRTKAALTMKRGRGERTGAVPFGWCVGVDGKKLLQNPAEQAVLRFVRREREEGRSLRRIVRECEERGFTSRSGRPLLKTQIERMLKGGRS